MVADSILIDAHISSKSSRYSAPNNAGRAAALLVLDSTGLQLFGQGEWDAEKHGRTRRHWRKLHLAVDAGTSQITAYMMTDGNADDAVQAPALLRQAEGRIASVIADGAYDSAAVYRAAARQHDPPPDCGRAQTPATVMSIVQRLYDSEINVWITSFWDDGLPAGRRDERLPRRRVLHDVAKVERWLG
ncbi:MAG: transposase [Steroidobacterales bacterium]